MKQLGIFLGMHGMMSGSASGYQATLSPFAGADYVVDRASGGSHITLNDGHKEGSMYKYKNFLWVSLLSFCLLQCSQSTEPETDDPPPLRTPAQLTASEKNLVESCNEFGFKLFRQIVENTHPDSNIFISPLSVSYALAMVYNGAAGETRQEIASALELSGFTIDEVNLAYKNLAQILINADPDVDFTIANSLWYRTNVPVLASYKENMRDFFLSRVEELDFSAPWAADTINSWVYENTNGKIDKIIDPPIPDDVIMYLMNAIYFRGGWTFPFDPEYTGTFPFELATGSEISCQMMYINNGNERTHASDTTITYFASERLQAASLPFGRENFRMLIILPSDSQETISFPGMIYADSVSDWIGKLTNSDFYLLLPKFRFSFKSELKNSLSALGIQRAFDPETADFSGLSDSVSVFVSKVSHKAFIQVDEKGAEAAAVTSVEAVVISSPPPLIANRAFLFYIYEERSGAIIFMGKLANPVWDE